MPNASSLSFRHNRSNNWNNGKFIQFNFVYLSATVRQLISTYKLHVIKRIETMIFYEMKTPIISGELLENDMVGLSFFNYTTVLYAKHYHFF